MKYREQLLYLILDENENAMMEWIEKQPLLEQPDILRELKEIAIEMANENGDDINEVIDGFESFKDEIDNYEDKILDEKLAEANYVMALDNQEKAAKDMFEAVEGMREYVIECITTNAPNAEAMRELAKQIIKFEVDAGVYNPENWAAIQ
jgi:Mg2+ and Co2+ transporter CorA